MDTTGFLHKPKAKPGTAQRDAVPGMAQPTSSVSSTTRDQYLQAEEEEYPFCLVTFAVHIQLWGCCPYLLLTAAAAAERCL